MLSKLSLTNKEDSFATALYLFLRKATDHNFLYAIAPIILQSVLKNNTNQNTGKKHLNYEPD